MGYKDILEFLSAPTLPDIIAYALLAVMFILQSFIKRFVKKDNSLTVFKVDTRVNMLTQMRSDLAAAVDETKAERARFEKERALHKQEVAALQAELDTIKEAIRFGFGNVASLVRSGQASKIASMLPTKADGKIKESPAQAEDTREEN